MSLNAVSLNYAIHLALQVDLTTDSNEESNKIDVVHPMIKTDPENEFDSKIGLDVVMEDNTSNEFQSFCDHQNNDHCHDEFDHNDNDDDEEEEHPNDKDDEEERHPNDKDEECDVDMSPSRQGAWKRVEREPNQGKDSYGVYDVVMSTLNMKIVDDETESMKDNVCLSRSSAKVSSNGNIQFFLL